MLMEVAVAIPFRGDYRAWVAFMKDLAATTWRETLDDPADDPQPLAVFVIRDDAVVVPVPGVFMRSPQGKDVFIRSVVVPLIQLSRCRKVALTASAWTADEDSPAGRELVRARDAGEDVPNFTELGLNGVREIATLLTFDEERHELWEADVTRHGDRPPDLGEWVIEKGEVAGAWVDPVVMALR